MCRGGKTHSSLACDVLQCVVRALKGGCGVCFGFEKPTHVLWAQILPYPCWFEQYSQSRLWLSVHYLNWFDSWSPASNYCVVRIRAVSECSASAQWGGNYAPHRLDNWENECKHTLEGRGRLPRENAKVVRKKLNMFTIKCHSSQECLWIMREEIIIWASWAWWISKNSVRSLRPTQSLIFQAQLQLFHNQAFMMLWPWSWNLNEVVIWTQTTAFLCP